MQLSVFIKQSCKLKFTILTSRGSSNRGMGAPPFYSQVRGATTKVRVNLNTISVDFCHALSVNTEGKSTQTKADGP